MNCEHARLLLPHLRYGSLTAAEHEQLASHLAACGGCAESSRALEALGQALDAAPTPAVSVDLQALYRQAAELDRSRLRRWRRVAWVATAAAVMFLALLGLRFEMRWHQNQLVIGWGTPAAQEPVVLVKEPAALPPALLADLQLIKELIHEVAADVEVRDHRRLLALDGLEKRLDAMTAASNRRWTVTQNEVRALYTAYFGTREKGE